MRWLIEAIWRQLTDRKVHCRICGVELGYVVRNGHTDWVCATDSPTGSIYPITPQG